MPDAAWIITIGQDVSDDVISWKVIDDEQGASEIQVKLANLNDKYTDAFDIDQGMEIRFGWQNELSDPAFLPVAKIKPDFDTKSGDTIEVTGHDPTKKLGGGHSRGKHKAKDGSMMIQDALKSQGLTPEGSGEGAKLNNPAAYNENDDELLYRLMPSLKGGGGGGGGPESGMGKDGDSKIEGTEMERDGGHLWSSPAGLSEEGKDFEDNRGKCGNNAHGAEPLTATLELKGYPKLKGKTCVDVHGFGSKWSGTWYAKRVEHKYDKGGAYKTTAHLCRGGTGKGGAGGDPPMVMYGELYKKKAVYYGPRKSSGGGQSSFMRGDGIVIKFEPELNPQPQKGAGEPKKGKGRSLDIRDALKDMEVGPAAEGGGGGGK
jgi:hypothetical protein